MSRSRELKQEFFVSKSELEIIKKRMEIMGVTNKSVFYRKMDFGWIYDPERITMRCGNYRERSTK